MIELPRPVAPPSAELCLRVLGVGGAGSNLLDRIQIDGAPGLELVALNTDVQKLTASVAAHKVQ
jgi:cell division protein FtsZ